MQSMALKALTMVGLVAEIGMVEARGDKCKRKDFYYKVKNCAATSLIDSGIDISGEMIRQEDLDQLTGRTTLMQRRRKGGIYGEIFAMSKWQNLPAIADKRNDYVIFLFDAQDC